MVFALLISISCVFVRTEQNNTVSPSTAVLGRAVASRSKSQEESSYYNSIVLFRKFTNVGMVVYAPFRDFSFYSKEL